eukprot:COSAG05_NODE_4181_length_1634_cov_2.828013_1_plen_149_part_00
MSTTGICSLATRILARILEYALQRLRGGTQDRDKEWAPHHSQEAYAFGRVSAQQVARSLVYKDIQAVALCCDAIEQCLHICVVGVVAYYACAAPSGRGRSRINRCCCRFHSDLAAPGDIDGCASLRKLKRYAVSDAAARTGHKSYVAL